MKKPPKPKVKKQHLISTTPLPAPQNVNNTKPTTEPKLLQTQQGEKGRSPSQVSWLWKEFWAYAGPIVSLIGFYFLLAPQISVEPTISLDPTQTLSTQLLIKNVGHVPVYNIH